MGYRVLRPLRMARLRVSRVSNIFRRELSRARRHLAAEVARVRRELGLPTASMVFAWACQTPSEKLFFGTEREAESHARMVVGGGREQHAVVFRVSVAVDA